MNKAVICLGVLVLVGAALVLPGCSSSSDGGVIPGGADPPCSDATGNRFVDCGNGTVTDTTTGLIWLKDADCLGFAKWADANAAAANLAEGDCGLTDGSSAGDWRLPTLECPSGLSCVLADATGEFASIFAPSCPAPFIPDTVGSDCWGEGYPFSGVQSDTYWSSMEGFGDGAWGVYLGDGRVLTFNKTNDFWVWPVRGGP